MAAPAPVPAYMQQQGMPAGNQFNQLQSFLTGDFDVVTDDLSSGVVPADADLLLIVDPVEYSAKQVFAVDQYLMKGGTVILASGAFSAQINQGSLVASARNSGLSDWLNHHGVSIEQALVMDPQNAAFPVPVTRQVGGFTFQDLQMLDYPYFPDVRSDGLDEELAFFAGIPQLTLSWASPLSLDPSDTITAQSIVCSSEGSWTSADTNVMPQFEAQGVSGFVPQGEQKSAVMGALLKGKFNSFFAGQDSPLLDIQDDTDAESEQDSSAANGESEEVEGEAAEGFGVVSSVIEHSTESARLIVFSSNDFLADQTLQMVGSADGTLYVNSVQLVTNIVDWATEDESLVGIRARGNFNRPLVGLDETQRSTIEWLNYLAALCLI